MIWFNIEDLEDRISNDELSEKDGFHYLLAFIIFTTTDIGSFYNHNTGGWAPFLGCVVQILITIWGMKVVYKVNNEIDGKDFLKRFLAISWVVFMRIFVIVFILTIILGLVLLNVLNDSLSNQILNYLTDKNITRDLIGACLSSLLPIICFLLIRNSFRNLKINIDAYIGNS